MAVTVVNQREHAIRDIFIMVVNHKANTRQAQLFCGSTARGERFTGKSNQTPIPVVQGVQNSICVECQGWQMRLWWQWMGRGWIDRWEDRVNKLSTRVGNSTMPSGCEQMIQSTRMHRMDLFQVSKCRPCFLPCMFRAHADSAHTFSLVCMDPLGSLGWSTLSWTTLVSPSRLGTNR